jgi:hypothetical protein
MPQAQTYVMQVDVMYVPTAGWTDQTISGSLLNNVHAHCACTRTRARAHTHTHTHTHTHARARA